MRGISIKAIALATLAVFGVDIVWGMVLAGIFDGPTLTGSMTGEQKSAALAALVGNRGYLSGVLILGTASTVLGGYLTARLARELQYFNALAFGALGVLLGVLTSAGLPLWFRVIGLGFTIPAALFGAYLCKRQPDANQ
ncbi:MAG: hypothetical protein ACREV5_03290 [Steroidobacter sp.]